MLAQSQLPSCVFPLHFSWGLLVLSSLASWSLRCSLQVLLQFLIFLLLACCSLACCSLACCSLACCSQACSSQPLKSLAFLRFGQQGCAMTACYPAMHSCPSSSPGSPTHPVPIPPLHSPSLPAMSHPTICSHPSLLTGQPCFLKHFFLDPDLDLHFQCLSRPLHLYHSFHVLFLLLFPVPSLSEPSLA